MSNAGKGGGTGTNRHKIQPGKVTSDQVLADPAVTGGGPNPKEDPFLPATVHSQTITRHTVTVQDNQGNNVELRIDEQPTEYLPDSPVVRVERRDDGGYRARYLIDDHYPYHEFPPGVTFEEFRDERSRDQFISEHEGPDRTVFIVDRYEHGLVHYSVQNTGSYPDRQWDVAPSGAIALPTGEGDYTNPEEAANAIMDEYSSYVNGDAYVVVEQEYRPDGTPDGEAERFGGIFGSDQAEEALQERM